MLDSSSDRLVAVRSAFDSWRASNSKFARIPDHLWLSALSLLDLFPLSVVARELNLSPARLRRRLKLSPPSLNPTDPPQQFVRIPPAVTPSPNSFPPNITADSDPLIQSHPSTVRLVIELADGCRLSVCLPSSNFSYLQSLCSSFLKSR